MSGEMRKMFELTLAQERWMLAILLANACDLRPRSEPRVIGALG